MGWCTVQWNGSLYEMATRSQCWHFLISASRRCCRSWTSCYKLHILSAHSIYGYYMEIWLARKIVAATNQHLGGPHCRDAFGNDRQVSRTVLTHWGRVTHICVSEIIIIGSDNGLSPGRRQAIIWTNARILLIGPWEIISMKFHSKSIHFHSRKCICKCRLRNGVYFVSASMC